MAYFDLHEERVVSSFLTNDSKLSSARHFCSNCRFRPLINVSLVGYPDHTTLDTD